MRYVKSIAKWVLIWFGSQFAAGIAIPGAGDGDERVLLAMLIIAGFVLYALVQRRVGARDITTRSMIPPRWDRALVVCAYASIWGAIILSAVLQ